MAKPKAMICPMKTPEGKTVYVSVKASDDVGAIMHLHHSNWISDEEKALAESMGPLQSTGEFFTLEEFARRIAEKTIIW